VLATAEPQRALKGLDLARSGAVADEDLEWSVQGHEGRYFWLKAQGQCSCQDHKRYPQSRCKHMIAVLIHQEACRLLEAEDAPPMVDVGPPRPDTPPSTEALATSCPEALFSLNVKVTLHGRDGQLTVRGQSIEEFVRNLQAVKDVLTGLDREGPAAAAAHPVEETH